MTSRQGQPTYIKSALKMKETIHQLNSMDLFALTQESEEGTDPAEDSDMLSGLQQFLEPTGQPASSNEQSLNNIMGISDMSTNAAYAPQMYMQNMQMLQHAQMVQVRQRDSCWQSHNN